MTTIADTRLPVTGGVDTHLDVHVAAVVTAVGGVLGTAEFPTTAAGYRLLVGWMRSFGELDQVGVEGTGTYGVSLARHLRTEQVPVVEVMRPNRQVRRRYGKTDVVDAIAAARAVLSGEANAVPKTHDGPVEALRTLKVVQRSATKARTQAVNQLRALLVTAADDLRARLRDLSQRKLLATCAAFRISADDDSLAAVTRFALRELARRVLLLTEQLEQVKLRLKRITEQVAPALTALTGVGPDVASTLLLTAGDNPERLVSERSFASLCGVSPVQASSGKTHRHRLNRGGDRQANAALWRIALVRLNCDQRTKDYLAKRVSDGKSKTEAIRCLKRYIAREVFAALPVPAAT